jgi:NADH-quinone oxidoreductase subunit J
MLEAEFLAAVQVLIYIGAVAILLMFGIMLTRDAAGAESDLSGGWRPPAMLAGLALFAALAFGINNAVSPSGAGEWSRLAARPALEPADALWKIERSRAIDDMPRVVGEQFMTRYALAFELAGLLLTAALVGGVALAREDRADDDTIEPESGGEAETAPVAPEQPAPTAAP